MEKNVEAKLKVRNEAALPRDKLTLTQPQDKKAKGNHVTASVSASSSKNESTQMNNLNQVFSDTNDQIYNASCIMVPSRSSNTSKIPLMRTLRAIKKKRKPVALA